MCALLLCRCVGTRELMNHHQICRIPTCPVCVPVNNIIADENWLISMLKQQQQQQQDRAADPMHCHDELSAVSSSSSVMSDTA